MDKKKSIDLIKLEVLGCLNDKDIEHLSALKTETNEFPWKVLGDYQNLIAFLPLSLELKYPSSDLKDKTAMKLYSIRDEIKAKIDAKKAQEVPAQPVEVYSDSEESTEEIFNTEQIEMEENVFAEVEVEEEVQFNTESASSGKDESFKFVSKFKDKKEKESLYRQSEEIVPKEPPKPVVDKELVEKISRDFLKTTFEREIGTLRKSVTKNRILSFILFVISLVLILAMYFIK